jgi:hypothetical protein
MLKLTFLTGLTDFLTGLLYQHVSHAEKPKVGELALVFEAVHEIFRGVLNARAARTGLETVGVEIDAKVESLSLG